MKTKEQLYHLLNQLGITYKEYEHEPLFTVEQAHRVTQEMNIPGAGCKNLFLKDSKKRVWLIVALADTKIELKKVAKMLEAPELRFADATLLKQYLGVEPGSVTPFGLINDTGHEVHVVLDKAMFEQSLLGFHPLANTATVIIEPIDLQKFVAACGNKKVELDFTA